MSWLDKVSRDFVLEKALRIPLCIHECLKDEGCVGKLHQGQKDICICLETCKDIFLCGCSILDACPSFPHSLPLILSACQAVSQGLCVPLIRRRAFVVRCWRFVSEEGIWLCII